MPIIDDWLTENFIKENKFIRWNEGIKRLHQSNEAQNSQSRSFRRLVFDELCANFITLSENRKRIKKSKVPKKFDNEYSATIIKNLPFKLTLGQKKL